jgi:hypothetical protein
VLKEDYELSREDIQDLSNRDALAAFFAKLGYNTNERLLQNAAAMGFGSEMLKSAITSIERLASEDGGLLEVYLVELKSVTVAVTRALAQAFRNLSVLHPLLVLTDDYQRLDFVLVERYTASSFQESTLPGLPTPLTRQVGVRPRVLTINRLKPRDVELRVLRRFSYTESDSLAQYDKLLSAYDVAEWSEPFFNSRALFSDYYLMQRLPESLEWKAPAEATAMTRAYRTLRDLYADVREAFVNQPGAVVRANLFVPTLQALGFTIEPTKADLHDAIEPDYRLSATANSVPSPSASPTPGAATWMAKTTSVTAKRRMRTRARSSSPCWME